MITPLFWATLALAGADWNATGSRWKSIRYFTKPAALIALLLWFLQAGGFRGGLLWFGLGLIFSLAGDILLMLPNRFFIGGLIAFLLAHVAYIFGFGLLPLPMHWGTLLSLVVVLLAGFLVLRSAMQGIRRQPDAQQLVIPTQIYGLIISLMLFAALLTFMRPEWPLQAALFASIGAALFFTSDSILVHNRFVKPVRFGNVLVMVTYHTGQILIAAGALMAFSS